MRRLILLIIKKIESIFLKSLSFSSQIEYSEINRKAKIWGRCKVFHSSIGAYSYLGRDCRLIHSKVGKFCSIAGGCAIGMGTHSLNYLSTSSIFAARKNGLGESWTKDSFYDEYKEVLIGNDVWIGQRVMIMGGVIVGDGAVIGAGAIVTKDIPPYAIVGGVPAKIIRYRFPDEIIEKLEKSEWWTLEDKVIRANIELFQKPLKDENLSKLLKITGKYV